MECPICQASIPPRAENPAYPFCSRRCQLIDLGCWLDGEYRIPGEPVDDVVALPGDADVSVSGSGSDSGAGSGDHRLRH